MHTVVETPHYLAAAKAAGMDEEFRTRVTTELAAKPDSGVAMQGTGGFRKLRFARLGGGKSGGVRVVTFFSGPNLPVFLIDVFAKSDKANLTPAERNGLATFAKTLVTLYQRREVR